MEGSGPKYQRKEAGSRLLELWRGTRGLEEKEKAMPNLVFGTTGVILSSRSFYPAHHTAFWAFLWDR